MAMLSAYRVLLSSFRSAFSRFLANFSSLELLIRQVPYISRSRLYVPFILSFELVQQIDVNWMCGPFRSAYWSEPVCVLAAYPYYHVFMRPPASKLLHDIFVLIKSSTIQIHLLDRIIDKNMISHLQLLDLPGPILFMEVLDHGNLVLVLLLNDQLP